MTESLETNGHFLQTNKTTMSNLLFGIDTKSLIEINPQVGDIVYLHTIFMREQGYPIMILDKSNWKVYYLSLRIVDIIQKPNVRRFSCLP